MGTDINFRKHLGRTYGTYIGLPAFDPAASAYFASTGITGATQQQAINNLVKGLKQDGLWSKMKAVYPFVTDNRNLLGYTEDFSNVFWLKSNTTVTANSTTAPNGTLTADTLTPTTSTSGHSVGTNSSVISGSVVVVNSIYVKANGYNYVGLSDNTTGQAVFNLSDGSIVSSDSGITAFTPENAGNGWWRISIRFTATTARGLGIDVWNNATKTPYAGNGTSGIFIWGAQIEVGSTATTYQPIATTQQAFISNQFKYNLVNPVDSDAAFRLVFNGGWTHSANGATPNGVNAYADTRLNVLSTLANYNSHMSLYNRTQSSGNILDIGAGYVNGENYSAEIWRTFSTISRATNAIQAIDAERLFFNYTGTPNIQANYIWNTPSQSKQTIFRNSAKLVEATTTLTSSPRSNTNIYIGALLLNGNSNPVLFSNRQSAFASIGDGLTDTEAANLYTRVQAFQTQLSRQVP